MFHPDIWCQRIFQSNVEFLVRLSWHLCRKIPFALDKLRLFSQPFSTSSCSRFKIAFPWLSSATSVYQSLVIHSSVQGLCICINLIVKQKEAFTSFSCCLQESRKEIFTLPDIKRLKILVFYSAALFVSLENLKELHFPWKLGIYLKNTLGRIFL